MRRLFALLAGTALVMGLASCEPTPPLNAIVLVHGWNSSPGAWDTFVQRLQADGFPTDRITNFDYDDSQSNVKTANELATAIDQTLARTGATKVDVVTHSMGALPIRYLVKNNSAYWTKVESIVTLAATNHGTNLAYLWFSASANEMKPSSSFLSNLNAVDETPGPMRWGTFWSDCDLVILPNSSALLAGAVNTDSGCLGHSEMHDDGTVYAGTKAFISQKN